MERTSSNGAEASESKRLLACGNCSFETTNEDDLVPVKDLALRVAPGELHPYGECPDCGALVHAVEQPSPIDEALVTRVIAYLKERGWELKSPATRVVVDPNPHPGVWSKTDTESWAEYEVRISALYKSIPDEQIWAFPVADGHAQYRVYDETPLRLQHIPYGDAWKVPTHVINGLDGVELRKRFFGKKSDPAQPS